MAYIIHDDLEDKYIKTVIEFSESEAALKAFFSSTPANPYTISDANWYSGTLIPPEVVPKKARITKGEAIYDWRVVRGGAVLVSERLKVCVEEVEPGHHQFFPIAVEDRKGVVKPGPYFIFNVVGYVEAIIEERSNLKPLGRGQIRSWGYQRDVGPWKCALNASIVAGRACWTDLRYGGRWFVSDRFVATARVRGLEGYRLDEYCEEVVA